ncbi:radical SAM family heme chaperone HemW [Buchnera aphidicola]|uniref:Heme chaperone HemW n=1 Tax=Buchnera aphidicola (Stegophylla sp.) TaxID=2315800 RepID=A0A4D6YKJ8_9GAMM|nr:radical SAM family heme chaperone HemW [Buchnera aphidicola (Stegophylla sp.)]QCI26504.1 radical SAM family heme chaperone HemW [Buchnera aphidicola (Stegophylla sp.)]
MSILLPDLSLYIHIPWCKKKCPYCDFHSYQSKNSIPELQYIQSLIQDLKNDIHLINNRSIKSIFIGGGTPNLINYKYIKYLLHNIKNIVSLNSNSEITIEINPDLITIHTIRKYIQLGINRISIGIQSFNNKLLKSIGREHSAETAINILNQIKKKKINFNIDLMYGLPQQTLQECLYDLKTAILMKPNHISWYQLNIEKNTIFYSKKIHLPNENTIWNMYNQGNKLLTQSKYIRYEISSYSQKKYQCQHNLNYWKFQDYIGIGCGAHGKITTKNKNIIRTIKKYKINDYINSNQYIQKKYKILDKNKPLEYFMNIFRLFQPIKRKYFTLYTGLNKCYIKNEINTLIKKKYIVQTKKFWYTLPKGKIFLNNLLEYFIK